LWGGAAHCGIIIFDDKAPAQKGSGGACQLPHLRGRVVCGSEVEAVAQLQLLVEELDPDVVCGFDIQRGSIGYILDRCAHVRWVPRD
jgi:DNA polymerase elongation subunit (family B)